MFNVNKKITDSNPNVWDYIPEDLKEELSPEIEMATMPNIDNQINYIEEGR